MQLQNFLNYFIISYLSRPCDCCYRYAYTYVCISITAIELPTSAHRACESLWGKAKGFLKDTILSSQSCSQTEWASVAEAVQLLLLLPLWGCCWLQGGLAQLVTHWTSQPHRLHCCTGMQPGARSDSCRWLWAALAQEGLCTLEVIGEVGSGEELPELHRLTFWECESGPLAVPPALL